MNRCLGGTLTALFFVLPFFVPIDARLSWSQPEIMYRGDYQDSPNLSINDRNQAMAIWVYKNGDDQKVQSGFYTDGWRSSDVSARGNPWVFNPKVALNDSGHAIAMWQRYGRNRTSLQVARYFEGMWGKSLSLLSIPHGTSNMVDLQIALNNAEQGVAVWTMQAVTGYTIRAALYGGQGEWQTEGSFTTFSADAGNQIVACKVALNSQGDVVLVWQESDVIKAATYRNGDSYWSEPLRISASVAGGAANQPQVSMNDRGDAIAVWCESSEISIRLQMATLTEGKWSQPSTVAAATGWIDYPAVALNNQGNALMTWRSDSQVYAMSQNGGMWGPSHLLTQAGWYCNNYKMVFNDLNQAIVIYTAYEPFLNPPPFPPAPKTFGFAVALSEGVWESPTLLLESVLDVALNHQGQAFVLGASVGTLQTKRGAF